MFGIGLTELLIILVVALVIVGPEHLPSLGRQLGTLVRDVRRMYANLRADLGPDFDEIERSIRELRALDPRQQVRDYSRSLLDDLSADAPELQKLAQAPRLNLEQLGRTVLHDDLLDQPLKATLAASPPAEPPLPAEATHNGTIANNGTAAVEPSAPSSSDARPLDAPSSATPPPNSRPQIEATGHYE
jgi:sec-independent protein translocase protein TatB